MSAPKSQKRKSRAGRPLKPESEKFVLLAGKVPPEVAKNIERIAQSKRWTVSGTIRFACELLIDSEQPKAA